MTDVAALLTRVAGWGDRARVVSSLDGGITNRNLLVDVDGERFVLRLPGHDTELLEIRRLDELDAARRAARLGIGPEVVAFIEPERYLVTRFVEARTAAPADVAAGDTLAAVASMLRAFHGTGPLAGDFDAFRVPGLHRAAAASRGVAIPAAYADVVAVASRIEAAFAASPEPAVPCHNDLLPANFLLAHDGKVWLLDWEYAGNNDRYFDLGNLAVNNELDEAGEERLVASYFGTVSARRLARLRLMKVMSDAREAMWAVVQQGISSLDFDYVAYAGRHFERLLANAARPEFGTLLNDAATGSPEPDRGGTA